MDWRATSEDWLKRLAVPAEATGARLVARRELLLSAAALSVLFVLFAGLSIAAACLGLALLFAWAALFPTELG
ncbi:hypothetical protein ABTN16_19395, partial [Acinetobacter baumannii]